MANSESKRMYTTVRVFPYFKVFSFAIAILGIVAVVLAFIPWFLLTCITGEGPYEIAQGFVAGINGIDLGTGVWHYGRHYFPLGFTVPPVFLAVAGMVAAAVIGVIAFIGYIGLDLDNTSATARVVGMAQVAAGAVIVVGMLLVLNQLNPITGYYTAQVDSYSIEYSFMIGAAVPVELFLGGVIASAGAIMALSPTRGEKRELLRLRRANSLREG